MPPNRDNRNLRRYFREIQDYDPLATAEEAALIRLIQSGRKKISRTALDKLIQANLRFVIAVAKDYQGQGLSLPDLISEGNYGLVKAAYRFDPGRDVKFISYAVWWVRQSIRQGIARYGRTIRIPSGDSRRLYRLKELQAAYRQRHDRSPTKEEMANAVDMEMEELEELLRRSQYAVSLDAPQEADDGATLMDLLEQTEVPSPESETLPNDLRRELEAAFASLSDREQRILRLYYGIESEVPQTLYDIGSIFDISRERVRQIKEEALNKLRGAPLRDRLRDYLD